MAAEQNLPRPAVIRRLDEADNADGSALGAPWSRSPRVELCGPGR